MNGGMAKLQNGTPRNLQMTANEIVLKTKHCVYFIILNNSLKLDKIFN